MQTTANHNASATSPFRGIKGVVFCILAVLLLTHCKPQRKAINTDLKPETVVNQTTKNEVTANQLNAKDSFPYELAQNYKTFIDTCKQPCLYALRKSTMREGESGDFLIFNDSIIYEGYSANSHYYFKYFVFPLNEIPVIQKIFSNIRFVELREEEDIMRHGDIVAFLNNERYIMPWNFNQLLLDCKPKVDYTSKEIIECFFQMLSRFSEDLEILSINKVDKVFDKYPDIKFDIEVILKPYGNSTVRTEYSGRIIPPVRTYYLQLEDGIIRGLISPESMIYEKF